MATEPETDKTSESDNERAAKIAQLRAEIEELENDAAEEVEEVIQDAQEEVAEVIDEQAERVADAVEDATGEQLTPSEVEAVRGLLALREADNASHVVEAPTESEVAEAAVETAVEPEPIQPDESPVRTHFLERRIF